MINDSVKPQSAESQLTTEQAILAAAEEEFLAKGYDGARMTSIAARAGVNHALLHYYFRSKEAMFEQVLQSKIRLVAEQIFSLFIDDNQADIAARIIAVTERHFDLVASNPKLPMFVINEFAKNPGRLSTWFDEIGGVAKGLFGHVQRQLDEAHARGEIVEVTVVPLLTDIVCLNLSSVVLADGMSLAMGMDRDAFLKMRKEENVRLIESRIRQHS